MNTEFWSLIPEKNVYEKTEAEGFSVFPTIVNAKDRSVFCRRCHRWEKIIHFQKNTLLTQCGAVYKDLFFQENSTLNYSYAVKHKGNSYFIRVNSQFVSTKNRKIFYNDFVLDLTQRRLFKNNAIVFDVLETRNFLAKEITNEILEEMGESYKEAFGIKPTVASKLTGFPLLTGYMLSPFNINFYLISQHWGLNPYDKDFMNLSSGNTPTAENEMFESLDIKATKTVRKMYQKNPVTVICYAAAKDMGFTDVNILQKTYSPKFYLFLKDNMISFAAGYISYGARDGLKQFTADLIPLSNQKTVWNSICRTVDYYLEKESNQIHVIDGLRLYTRWHENLSNDDKKDIMHEGFNEYTHDYLVRRANEFYGIENASSNQRKEEIIPFEIEDKFLALEYKAGENFKKTFDPKTGKEDYEKVPDEERYCFYVALNSQELRDIGSAMHNCVGWGYAQSVAKRHCTIVYAKYQKKYCICIEVTPEFTIRQSLGPCNQPLKGDALQAYFDWCKAKHIKYRKAFTIRTAR